MPVLKGPGGPVVGLDIGSNYIKVVEARLGKDRAVITAVEEQRHFYADVELERDGERRVLSARPSDAIALALRSYGAEILVAEQVMVDLGLGEPPVDN